MEKQFVTYDIALKLKELGFNEPCLAYYNLHKNDSTYGFNISIVKDFNEEDPEDLLICSAPLWQQVIDWFRENHRFHIEILPIPYFNNSKIAYFYHIDSDDLSNPIYDYQDKYSEVLDASEQDVPGNYLNQVLYNKNLFEMDFAYVTYDEAREKAILKAIELWKNN